MDILIADIKYLKSYKIFLFECFSNGLLKYESALHDPKSYLHNIIVDSPQTSSYFCMQGNEILGVIRCRHYTTPYIESVIGHVGYETKPSARGKGVAKFMLFWLQENVLTKDIVITCEANNLASKKVIESCGGQYINQIYSPEKKNEVKRFQLALTH